MQKACEAAIRQQLDQFEVPARSRFVVREELRARLFTLHLELIESGSRVTTLWVLLREIAENEKYKASEVAQVLLEYEVTARLLPKGQELALLYALKNKLNGFFQQIHVYRSMTSASPFQTQQLFLDIYRN